MSIPTHRINIFGKPRQSYDLFGQYNVTNYRHKLAAIGGYDTASCNLAVSKAEAELIFANFIGNAITVHVDDPTMPIFDGYINAINYEIGNYTFRRSLDEMANRIRVTYYNADSPAAQKTEMTAVVNNTASQAIYGIKETNIDAGVHYNNADKTHKTVLRNTLLNVLAWPQVSITSGGGGGVTVSLEIKGWYHLWDWMVYENTGAVTTDAWTAFVDKAGGGSRSANLDFVMQVFPASGWANFATANASFNISNTSKTGQTYLQWLQSIAESGDGVNEWVFGITPRLAGKPGTDRYFYYRPSNTVITYTTRAMDNAGAIYDPFGNKIDPWRVKPDNGIRISDVLANFGSVSGDNPRESYIKFIEYDAESQSVSWQSSDDSTLEGAFNLRKYYKKHGKRFGAPIRQLV
jgi:hypothetical protein